MAKVRTICAVLLLLGAPGILSAQTRNADKATERIKAKAECGQMAGRTIPASAIGLPTRGAIIKSAKMDPGTGPIAIPADFVPEHQTPPYKVLRSRPLCRYPKYPRYKGKGDPEKMESYSCALPEGRQTASTSTSKP